MGTRFFSVAVSYSPITDSAPRPPGTEARSPHCLASGRCGMGAVSHLHTSLPPRASLASGCQVPFLPGPSCGSPRPGHLRL